MAGAVEAVTERLDCLRPAPEAAGEYSSLFGSPRVQRWIRPAPMDPLTSADIERILRHDLRHWDLHGFGPWTLSLRTTNEFVGRAGLAWTRVERRPVVELPWSLLPAFHGRGLATEAASAALTVAAGLGLKKVVSLTLVDNAASRRVMEKIGLVYQRDIEHYGLPHALYSADLRVWRERAPAKPAH